MLRERDFENLTVQVERFNCDFCEAKFFIPAKLDSHLENEHQETSAFKTTSTCSFCEKTISKNYMREHIKLRHRDLAVLCQFSSCPAVFKNHKSLKNHLCKRHFPPGTKAAQCKECKRWFTCSLLLSNHIKRQHGVFKITCRFCPETFGNKSDLKRHTRKNHDEKIIRCMVESCVSSFKSMKQMRDHFEEQHKKVCKFCHATFTSEQLFSSHFIHKHQEKKCKVYNCSFYTDSKQELEKHVAERHEKKQNTVTCFFCDRIFANKYTRALHVSSHHSDVAFKFKCEHRGCLLFVRSREELDAHKKEAHRKKEKVKETVECLFCGKVIWDKGGYVDHIRRQHSDEAFRCKHKHCFSYFKSSTDLDKHYEEKHVGTFECDFCAFVTKKKKYLMYHLQMHHLVKDKKCPHCPKVFGSRPHLRSHIAYHHEVKRCQHCLEIGTNLSRHAVIVPCPVCKLQFPCRKLLSRHKALCKKVPEVDCADCGMRCESESALRIHLNQRHKPGQRWTGYKCKKCAGHFVTMKALRIHQLKEHPEMARNCDLCDEKFLSWTGLYAHKLNTHRVGQFECRVCDRKFLYKIDLERHLKWNHDKDNPKFQQVECADCGRIMKKLSLAYHYRTQH